MFSRRVDASIDGGAKSSAARWGFALLLLAACAPDLSGSQGRSLLHQKFGLGDSCYDGGCNFFGSSHPTHLTQAAQILTELEANDEDNAIDEAQDLLARMRRGRRTRNVSPSCTSEVCGFDSPDEPSEATPEVVLEIEDQDAELDTLYEESGSVSTGTSGAATPRQTFRPGVMRAAISALPLVEINELRAQGGDLAAIANDVAPQPVSWTRDLTFVRWDPDTFAVPAAPALPGCATAPRGGTVPFAWRCVACGDLSRGARDCTSCHASLATAACRVFVGQLRKDRTAALVHKLMQSLAPTVTIRHVESHTNGASGRGKGCAWVYVDSVEDAILVTEALHKTVFVDVDTAGKEGFWVVTDDALVPSLRTMAEAMGQDPNRPLVLPRQPVVAELPATSLIRQLCSTAGALRSGGFGTHRFDSRGWPCTNAQ